MYFTLQRSITTYCHCGDGFSRLASRPKGVRHRSPTGVPGNHLKIDYSSKNRFHEKYSAVSNSTDYHIKPIVSHIICSRTAMADLF